MSYSTDHSRSILDTILKSSVKSSPYGQKKADPLRVLVTGGGGFLGQEVVKQLLEHGYEVHAINRNPYPILESWGVRCFQGDISCREDLKEAAEGCEAVIHTAAKAGVWGRYKDYYDVNVKGTLNVISVCQELGIDKLVYTSSPSVVFSGGDQNGVDARVSYPRSFLAHYPKTKAAAEKNCDLREVRFLSVVSLRPHLIWGPGDNHLAPRIIESRRQNRLKFVGGPRSKWMPFM